MTSAVIYSAKSTEDKHGSIGTQVEDCRAMAERHGWEVAGEFSDEAFSAWTGNRGPDLERAKALAVSIAREHGRCVLVAQDADRFARGAGDAPGAADHLGEVYFALKRQGVELWTVRSGHLDLLRAAIEGERSTDESSRKSQATRAGLKRRAERGQPVGAVPYGMKVEYIVGANDVTTRRVIDPKEAPVVERIFDLVEAGASFGHVVRVLHAEGIKTRRGASWNRSGVRDVIYNDAYAGRRGYPALIEPERFDAIHAGLKRLDPVAVQRRAGGRKPADPSFWLRSIASCRACGATMYTRRYATGRAYVCAHRREATGLCHAAPVPADLAEAHVLGHLTGFAGDVETWLARMAAERDGGRERAQEAVKNLRDGLAAIEHKREAVLADYASALFEGDARARLVLDAATKLDEERHALEQRIDEATAIAVTADDETSAADAIEALRTLSDAKTTEALNAAMSKALAGMYVAVEDGTLHAEFELAAPVGIAYLFQHAEPVGIEAERVTLPQQEPSASPPS